MESAIDLKITQRFELINMPDTEHLQLLSIASWSTTPWFPFPGRTAWHTFGRPPYHKDDHNCDFPAAKLKGVGVWNPQQSGSYSGIHGGSYCDQPSRPTTHEYTYTSQLLHIGFNSEGYYCQVHSETTPYGGIRHSRARQEYNNALVLCSAGVPSITPYLVIEYPSEYIFQGERLGAVITLSPEAYPYRMHPLHLGEEGCSENERAYYQAVRTSLGVTGTTESEVTMLRTIAIVSRQIGRLLHGFAEAGLYRHSGGWDNLQYSLRHKQVFFTDLDSSRNLEDLPDDVRPLQILRDLASALHKLLNKLYYPTVLDRYTVARLIEYDPLSEMIAGYFCGAPEVEVRKVSTVLWRYFVPHFCLLKRHREPILGDWTSERRKSYKMEEDLFYVLAITALYPLYIGSDLDQKYPAKLTIDDLRYRTKEYLGERYEYLQFMLDDIC